MTSTDIEYQASVEELSDIERKLAVEVPWGAVKGRLDDAYRELSRGVTLKGFRRGKVPRQMLERMFGDHVNKEVAQRLVQDSMAKALVEKEIKPVAEPKIDEQDLNTGEAFCYSAVLQVVPTVEAKDYFGADVIQRPAKVSDEEVERALESKQRELTEYKDIEGRNTRHGDVLLVDIMGKVGDEPIDEENKLVELSETPHEPLPGLAAKLMDIAPDTEELDLELELSLPSDPEKKAQARLLVTLKDVKEKIVPTLDDALAQNTGEAETLEELREKLHTQLFEMDEKRAKSEARNRLVEGLLEHNDVPVVPALVDHHLDRMIKMQMAMMGIAPDSGLLDQDALKEQGRAQAEKTVQGALLIEAISKQEKVEVTEADVELRLAELAKDRGDNVARVKSEYEQQGRLEQLKASLSEEKTLDLLMSKANIIIQEIPDEEPSEAEGNASSEAMSANDSDGSNDTE
ncbi:MAG: trigger factor [Deltaproteobacteria bacterium]|nr:trigger factor [Deltaproteobacteria bacterium]